MKKFEYKIEFGSEMLKVQIDQDLLNSCGQEGWELVAMEKMKTKMDGIGGKRQVYWFKREVQ